MTAIAVSIVFTPVSAVSSGGIIATTTSLNYFANRGAAADLAVSLIVCATACPGVGVGTLSVTNVGETGMISFVVIGGSAIALTLGAGYSTTWSTDQAT